MKATTSPTMLSTEQAGHIVLIVGNGNYSDLHLLDGSVIVSAYTLKRYQEKVPEFIRCHKRFLVNPMYIKSMFWDQKEGDWLTMMIGNRIPIARRRVSAVGRKLHSGEFTRRRQDESWKQALIRFVSDNPAVLLDL